MLCCCCRAAFPCGARLAPPRRKRRRWMRTCRLQSTENSFSKWYLEILPQNFLWHMGSGAAVSVCHWEKWICFERRLGKEPRLWQLERGSFCSSTGGSSCQRGVRAERELPSGLTPSGYRVWGIGSEPWGCRIAARWVRVGGGSDGLGGWVRGTRQRLQGDHAHHSRLWKTFYIWHVSMFFHGPWHRPENRVEDVGCD